MVILDLPTLFFLSTMLFLVMGVMFLVTWNHDRQGSRAMLHWGIANLMGVPVCVLLTMRGTIPDWASIGLANFILLVGFSEFLAGIIAFEGRQAHPAVSFGGPIVWFVTTQIPVAWSDFSTRVVVVSLVIAAYTGLAARLIWVGRVREPLPTRMFLTVILGLLAGTHLLRAGFTFMWPVQDNFSALGRGWTAFIAVQIMLQTVLLGYSLLALVKERAEDSQRRAAETDGLTGVLTRRAFRDRAATQLAQDPNRGAVLIFDLDRFKAVNDVYGHAGGDRVLAAFADVVRNHMAVADVFGRYGGEEFTLFLRDADADGAWQLAEDIRRDFAHLRILHEEQAIMATVSVGVAVLPVVGADLDRLVAYADAGLYAAKQAGRNRIAAVGVYDHIDDGETRESRFTGETPTPRQPSEAMDDTMTTDSMRGVAAIESLE